MIQRLRQHRGSESGGGNHRGSIFRLLIGQALLAEMSSQKCRSWGVAGDKKKASQALNVDRKTIDVSELPVEMAVSQKICKMPFICLGVDDEPGKGSLRSIIERNSIALLSNFDGHCIDLPSDSWLGHRSDRELVRRSGLWNQRHVNEAYNSGFLDVVESLIT